jgi:formylglycine-generating enzyme required for sulfatase activity
MKHTLLGISLCLLAALSMLAVQGQASAAESATPPPTPVLAFPTPAPTPTLTPTPTPTATATPALTPVTWQRPTDGMVMVYVPEGEFLMGSPAGQGADDEHPQHMVYLDAFWIDQTEVTNAQYRQCLEAGACRKPYYWDDSGYNAPDQPLVGVSWDDARTYCEWVGARLPTEAQWEKAARGTDGRKYPWGNEDADCDRANYYGKPCACGGTDPCVGKPSQVGAHPAGASPYGALDMAGNVWEWVADWYAADYYSRSPARNPQGPDSGEYRGLRGGSWYLNDNYVRSAFRYRFIPDLRFFNWGFRCVAVTSSL